MFKLQILGKIEVFKSFETNVTTTKNHYYLNNITSKLTFGDGSLCCYVRNKDGAHHFRILFMLPIRLSSYLSTYIHVKQIIVSVLKSLNVNSFYYQ